MFFPFLGALALLAVLFAGVLIIAVRAFCRSADSRMTDGRGHLCAPPAFHADLADLICWIRGIRPRRYFTARFSRPGPGSGAGHRRRLAGKIELADRVDHGLLDALACLEPRGPLCGASRRDDYRDAAQAGRAALAGGKRVWWVAAKSLANTTASPDEQRERWEPALYRSGVPLRRISRTCPRRMS